MNASCAIDHKAHSSAKIPLDHEWRITGHCDAYHTVLDTAMQVMQTLQTQALVDCLGSGTFQCANKILICRYHACLSEYHDDDRSLMLIKDARSADYAPGTLSSEEWARPMEVGSRNCRSLSLLFMTNDNGNCITKITWGANHTS